LLDRRADVLQVVEDRRDVSQSADGLKHNCVLIGNENAVGTFAGRGAMLSG
jgi:hypothetical protein